MFPEQKVKIGRGLTDEVSNQLKSFLISHKDNFTWCTGDMSRLDPRIVEYKLNINLTFVPIQQRPQQFKDVKAKGIEEVEKLLQSKFIWEVDYPTWLANVVMVKKANGKWKMCVDFTNLNKACLKDDYPFLRISMLVYSTSGCGILCFFGCIFWLHQIRMNEADEIHTSFQAAAKLYYYNVMSFGIKNVGVSYQRMMNKVFQKQIG